MAPKYQIFISSTYEDLKAERDQVIKAVLEMGHIPVGMEMFSAADEEQWKIIQRQIDSSDYYVVIVAHRYGSIVPDLGISYTEREYDYAIEKGVPTLGFVIDNSAEWPHSKYDTDSQRIEALGYFKTKVKQKPVQFWKSSGDLHAQVAIALMKTFNTQPRPGWVRADSTVGPEVSDEIARLSKENSELRIQNKQFSENSHPNKLFPLIPFEEVLDISILSKSGDSKQYLRHNKVYDMKFKYVLRSIKMYLLEPGNFQQPFKLFTDMTVRAFHAQNDIRDYNLDDFLIPDEFFKDIFRILKIHNLAFVKTNRGGHLLELEVSDYCKQVLASLPE